MCLWCFVLERKVKLFLIKSPWNKRLKSSPRFDTLLFLWLNIITSAMTAHSLFLRLYLLKVFVAIISLIYKANLSASAGNPRCITFMIQKSFLSVGVRNYSNAILKKRLSWLKQFLLFVFLNYHLSFTVAAGVGALMTPPWRRSCLWTRCFLEFFTALPISVGCSMDLDPCSAMTWM